MCKGDFVSIRRRGHHLDIFLRGGDKELEEVKQRCLLTPTHYDCKFEHAHTHARPLSSPCSSQVPFQLLCIPVRYTDSLSVCMCMYVYFVCGWGPRIKSLLKNRECRWTSRSCGGMRRWCVLGQGFRGKWQQQNRLDFLLKRKFGNFCVCVGIFSRHDRASQHLFNNGNLDILFVLRLFRCIIYTWQGLYVIYSLPRFHNMLFCYISLNGVFLTGRLVLYYQFRSSFRG